MFNWLQNKLGIISLAEKIEQHHQQHQLHWQVVTEQWKQTTLRLSSLDDQLLEMKERVKALERDQTDWSVSFGFLCVCSVRQL